MSIVDSLVKLTFRQLQVFDAVATTGSLTNAAAKLNMSQSAASIALTDLQAIMGRPLFTHAKGHPLRITDEGKRVRPIIRSLLGSAHELQRAQADAPLSGRLVVGATSVIADTVLPQLCIAFMQRHPGVQIHIEAEAVGELFQRLQRFELETALIENFPEVEGVELTRWRTDELILVVEPNHPLAGRKALQMRDMAGMAWYLREVQSSVSTRLRYMLHEEVGQLNVTFSATSNWALRHAVRAGGGIGCLSRALVKGDLEAGRLVELDVEDFHYTRALSLARPKQIWRNRLATRFDAFLLSNSEFSDL
jgi:DNA-binding transcriptional LysR family regulator